jgi:putative ABC transport system substrate-binding protein
MKRRDFIGIAGGVAATWAFAANAQQPAKLPRIGVLWHAGSAEQEGTNYRELVKGFADMGYIDGKTVVLQHRFPNEQSAQFRSMAAELVVSGVDVLVAIGANAPPYAKEATKTIPIVFAIVPDPIGSKLVNNLARPEANVTGLSNSAGELVGKRLALFKEVIPGLSRVALLVNSNSALVVSYEQTFQAAAAGLELSGTVFTWRAPDELTSTFAAMKDAGIQAVMFNPDGWAFTYRDLIAKLALAKGLPLSPIHDNLLTPVR